VIEPPAARRRTFDEIYAAEFGYVWHALRRLGTRPGDLEDLAHDVFVVVHRRLGDYEPARPLRPWLFGIAYRIVSERRRRASPPPSPGEMAELADPRGTPEADLASAETRRALAAALEGIDLDQRAVLVLHDVDEQPVPEIARALGLSVNTVYSRLRLARQKLARALTTTGSGETHDP
jgi:RNA polymerase sigma-70 factor, ECF subfamily